jgi:hypothetical protein
MAQRYQLATVTLFGKRDCAAAGNFGVGGSLGTERRPPSWPSVLFIVFWSAALHFSLHPVPLLFTSGVA